MGEAFLTHVPVMPEQCLEALAVKPDGVYVDATLGAGGHALLIADGLSGCGRLIGIDKDPEAVNRAAERLAHRRGNILLLCGDYRDMDRLLAESGVCRVDGVLFDLGVSSPQFDDPSRGFSYRFDAPLDMRMNPNDPICAYDVVNRWTAPELRRILYSFGEETHAHLIVAAIEKKRSHSPILTTGQLAELIISAVPPAVRRGKGHPAKRSFQAIRMAVNDELRGIEIGLSTAVRLLARGGRLAVLSFHSVEDRMVKTTLMKAARGCDCPSDFPQCVCGKRPLIKLLHSKPKTPEPSEMANNRRARGAKLRAAEKL